MIVNRRRASPFPAGRNPLRTAPALREIITAPLIFYSQPLTSLFFLANEMKKWTIEDSKELYNINGWGTSYFSINDKGNV